MYKPGDIVVFLAGVARSDELREGLITEVQELEFVVNTKPLYLYIMTDINTGERFDRQSKDVLGMLPKAPDEPTEREVMTRANILAEADRIIAQDRNIDYDSPERNFTHIANLWNSQFGTNFKSHEVATAMMLVKIARTRTSPKRRDHWVDIAGYAACGGECAEEEIQEQGVARK